MASKINTFTRNKIVPFLFFALFLSFSNFIKASDGHEPENHDNHVAVDTTKKKKVDMAAIAIEHVLDSHSWHLWGDHHDATVIPLPVILKGNNGFSFFSSSKFENDVHGTHVVEINGERFVNFEEDIYYASETPNAHGQYLEMHADAKGKMHPTNAKPLDFSITKCTAQLLLSALVLILLFTSIARAYKKTGVTSAPKGKQSFLEPLIVFVRDEIAKSNIGPEKYEKYVPYLLTVFFLILINNILGLIPISANLTGNIAFTFVLAVITFIVTTISANKAYWGHIFLPPAPVALYPILIPLEFLGIFTKPFALMIRLFANMTAGHIIVISLVGLIFAFESYFISPVAVGFALFIDILECLVALLQAYIFTLLTALFIGSAMVEHHHEEHSEEAAHH
ncbi:MAG: F0F1-type synthase, alpha subunit [Bacteroidetes bacterium]|jgi:F-type H+-transporting ATPase subunit a|nr:F0F1-type synthase, alpha subunit [Bacteroidota bacterium]